jgi:hypothetical protein
LAPAASEAEGIAIGSISPAGPSSASFTIVSISWRSLRRHRDLDGLFRLPHADGPAGQQRRVHDSFGRAGSVMCRRPVEDVHVDDVALMYVLASWAVVLKGPPRVP